MVGFAKKGTFSCFATKGRIASIKCAPSKSNVPPPMGAVGGRLYNRGSCIGCIACFQSITKAFPPPASCFPAQLLVCYFQLCNQALIWGICGLSSEMRPKCGPFPQFRILRVESNLGNKVMDGTLHLLRRHLNQHHDTPRSSMDCAYTLKL